MIETWRHGPKPVRILDVGVSLDLATHDIDLAQWLVGSEYASISAISGVSDKKQNLEDIFTSQGILKNKILVNHSVNWISAKKVRQIRITGSSGVLFGDLISLELDFYQPGTYVNSWSKEKLSTVKFVNEKSSIPISYAEPLDGEIRAFESYIEDGNIGNLSTVKNARKIIEILEESQRIELYE